MGLFNLLPMLEATGTVLQSQLGLIAIGAGIAIFSAGMSSIGESLICCHAIDGMTRNPEQHSKLQSTMILAVALDESCAIYAVIIAIIIIFVLGGKIS